MAGCGSDNNASAGTSGKTVITVGATPVPHAEILEQAKPLLEKEGIELKVVEFTDYVNLIWLLTTKNWMPTSSSTCHILKNSSANIKWT